MATHACDCTRQPLTHIPSHLGPCRTQFEAWLSVQAPGGHGLAAATPEQRRYDIVPIHGANRTMGDGLVAMWATKTPEEAHEILKEPDVTVTNQVCARTLQ